MAEPTRDDVDALVRTLRDDPDPLARQRAAQRIFAWPGIGSLALDAVYGRDYPILQAVIAVLAILIVLVNLIVDVVYGLIDPRIRTE